MSYGSGDNQYAYDPNNTGGYTGYDETNTSSTGFADYEGGYGGDGGYNEGAAAGYDQVGGQDSNPFDNYEANYDNSNYGDNTAGAYDNQYEVYGDNTAGSFVDNQYSQDYSLNAGPDDQYSVASSHASPDVLAETMELPTPSGPQSADVMGFPTQSYDTSAYGEAPKKKKKKKKKKKNYSWYELGYYKALFDFDTDEILRRLLSAINPVIYSKFWEETKAKPDLYVPVWGTTTLWFLLVACGTVASYITGDDCSSSVEFDKIGWGSFATYGYIFFPPLLWLILFKFWVDIPLGLFDNVCLYGYSLLPYLPTMFIALAIPFSWARWIPFGISCGLSSYFLFINYFKELKDHMKQGTIILTLMVLLNIGLCILYKMYFFEMC